MTGGAECVLQALVRMPEQELSDLKLLSLANQAGVSERTCRRAIRELADKNYIRATRDEPRGNVRYSFSVLDRARHTVLWLRYAVDE